MTGEEHPSVLLVGELNPFGADPRMALFYLPRTSSGNRLRIILGLSDVEYMRCCSRVNLCEGRWDGQVAHEEAATLLKGRPETVFVLLGLKVRQSFLVSKLLEPTERVGKRVVAVPHPSGLCRAWNDTSMVLRVRSIMSELVTDVPWGRGDAPDGEPAQGGSDLKVDT